MKVYYVVQNKKQISSGLTTILLDRIFGLLGLTFIGAIAIINIQTTNPTISTFKLFFPAFVTTFIFCFLARTPLLAFSRKISTKLPAKLENICIELNNSFSNYLSKFRPNLEVFAISIIIHLSTIIYFMTLSHYIADTPISFTQMCTIFAIGGILIAIPISPSGIGVGHVGFGYLFAMFGIKNGADIFNAFIISQLVLNMLGAPAYLTIKKEKTPEENENISGSSINKAA